MSVAKYQKHKCDSFTNSSICMCQMLFEIVAEEAEDSIISVLYYGIPDTGGLWILLTCWLRGICELYLDLSFESQVNLISSLHLIRCLV